MEDFIQSMGPSNNRWNYKNFNMGVELDIAGEFIYNGIHEIYRMPHFANDGPTFSALYDISVGIERLQKIVYVLWGMDEFLDDKRFEKSLITHSHTGLRDSINSFLKQKEVNVKFSERENDFLTILQTFYNSARYMRFNVAGEWNEELKLLRMFAAKYDLIDKGMDFYPDSYLSATQKMKEIIGRTVGSLSHKYYGLIKEGSTNNNTYTYELRSGSKAEKVFLGEHNKNSLMQAQIDESIAFKELLVYFRNAKCKDAFLKFVDEIEPLEFDPGLVVEYFETIIKGEVPQELVDDVEFMYGENEYSFDRIQQVSAFADRNVLYDYPMISKVWTVLEAVINGTTPPDAGIEELEQCKDYIYDDDIVETIDKAITLLQMYINGGISINELKVVRDEYKDYLISD